MKFFNKEETNVILSILLCLFIVVGINMAASLRRGRDSIRKDDISDLQKRLDTYYQKYRSFPLSTDKGEIVGCFEGKPEYDKVTGIPTNIITCKWGESKFESEHLMPRDPSYEKGAQYLYKSDGKSYELYISLEGKDEAEYTPSIALKRLQCGTKICNYGRVN